MMRISRWRDCPPTSSIFLNDSVQFHIKVIKIAEWINRRAMNILDLMDHSLQKYMAIDRQIEYIPQRINYR